MFSKNILKFKNVRKFSSCIYDKPFLFGPEFSTFFFGLLYTGFLMANITKSHMILKTEIENLNKEIKENKKL
jgi:hypothetical protein